MQRLWLCLIFKYKHFSYPLLPRVISLYISFGHFPTRLGTSINNNGNEGSFKILLGKKNDHDNNQLKK